MTRIGTGKLRQQNDHTILNDFVKQGIVLESEALQLGMGRPTQKYVIHQDFFHILVISIQRKKQQNYLYYEIKDALGQNMKHEIIQLDCLDQQKLLQIIIELYQKDSFIRIIGIGVPAIVSNGVLIESDIF